MCWQYYASLEGRKVGVAGVQGRTTSISGDKQPYCLTTSTCTADALLRLLHPNIIYYDRFMRCNVLVPQKKDG